MTASRFSEAQKAFVLRQAEEGEPEILRYAVTSIWPTGADGGQSRPC